MAEVLNDFNFKAILSNVYDWENWTNGKVWKLKPEVDFKSKASSFKTAVYNKAKELGTKVNLAEITENIISLDGDKPNSSGQDSSKTITCIVIQFLGKSPVSELLEVVEEVINGIDNKEGELCKKLIVAMNNVKKVEAK